MQFKSVVTTGLVFTGILVAWAGGFIMIWFYAQPWFLDWDIFGTSMRELFQAHPINLSVAIWVGFLALFGIASDDGVVVATYLKDSFAKNAVAFFRMSRSSVTRANSRRNRRFSSCWAKWPGSTPSEPVAPKESGVLRT